MKYATQEYLNSFPLDFGTIIADPPWNYMRTSKNEKLKGYSDKHYKPLTTEDLCQLPVNRIARDDSVLLLWATIPFVVNGDAQKVVEAWGFTPVTALSWVKTSKNIENLSYGVGYWFRGATELIMVGKRKRSYRSQYLNILTEEDDTTTELNGVTGLVSPALKHSRKPDELHKMVENIYPGPYLELFARTALPGWYAMGDETPATEGLDIREGLPYLYNRTSVLRENLVEPVAIPGLGCV